MNWTSMILKGIVAALFAILGPIGAAHANKADDTLVVALQRGILSVDYHYTTKREYIILSELTDDGLFYIHPDTLKPVPLAAKSFNWVDDVTLDVDIRPGIKFHDGSALTADDVVYTYKWTLNPKSQTNRGKQYAEWLQGIEKKGPMSVRFKLKYTYPLALTTLGRGIPLRKKGAFDADVAAGRIPNGQTLNGIGPYRLVKLDPGKSTIVERFEGYYKDSPKGRPAIKRIEMREIPDWGTQQAELISGGVQWMYDVPTDVATNMGESGQATYLNGPDMRIGFLILDAAGYTEKGGPLTKLQVRRAINHAINRESIVKNIVKGGAQVVHTACHPNQFGCVQNVMKYPYDPAKAKALLAEAGYPDGFPLEIWVYREKEAAEAILADLNKAGIKAKMRFVQLTSLDKARKEHQIAAYFGTWGSGGLADVEGMSNHFLPTTDRNMSGDTRVAEYMIGGQKFRDEAKRLELYTKGVQLIAEQAYWVPLYAFTVNYLTSKDLDFPVPKDGLPLLFQAKWK
ncbi:MAG: ABC transporter substrate-binding protein [Betaproteobacteria bacterium]|nr:MAG: ABC transporter substrate-binding protein [Betaproteobacteria bacterium]